MTTPRRPHLPTSPFQPPPERPVSEFHVGDRVSHDTHGIGRVTAVDATGITVDFQGRSARVPSPFSKTHLL